MSRLFLPLYTAKRGLAQGHRKDRRNDRSLLITPPNIIMEEKVEIEEYIYDGEIQIRLANGIIIFCTEKGKKILDNLRNKPNA